MDIRLADDEGDLRPATVAAEKLAETSARCAAANAHAGEALRRAEAALAAAQDRLQRAQAVRDAIRAGRAKDS